MKRGSFLLVILSILSYSTLQAQTILSRPKQVTVTGKIEHHDPNQKLKFYVTRLGFGRDEVTANIDSAGSFIAKFESYIPTDVWAFYKSNIRILTHPGDSIHMHFDGSKNDKIDFLNTLRFSADRSKTNNFAAIFQRMNQLSSQQQHHTKSDVAIKQFEPEQYRKYLDTLKSTKETLYQQFINEQHPDEESKKWAKLFVQEDYIDKLSHYAMYHREANHLKLSDPWDVPKGFFKEIGNSIPIDAATLVNGQALQALLIHLDRYIADQLKDNLPENSGGVNSGNLFVVPEIYDSLTVNSFFKYIPDTLMQQIKLTYHFKMQLDKQQIDGYEKYKTTIENKVTLPFLRVPLMQLYQQTKSRIDNPVLYTDAVLKELQGSSSQQMIDNIINSNKGKLIYIDFWATWCGPCLGEMANSKLVEQEMKEKNVAFVYLCMRSQQPEWKATVSKFQLGGQHFLLTGKQADEICRAFEISGIPFYMLMDQKGNILEKGNQLSPLNAREKMKPLLK